MHPTDVICEAVLLLPVCVGRERLDRCQTQHPKLSYLLNMYHYPCVENRIEFNEQYSCTSNVIASHALVRSCQDTLERFQFYDSYYFAKTKSNSFITKTKVNIYYKCMQQFF